MTGVLLPENGQNNIVHTHIYIYIYIIYVNSILYHRTCSEISRIKFQLDVISKEILIQCIILILSEGLLFFVIYNNVGSDDFFLLQGFSYFILKQTTSWKAMGCCGIIIVGFFMGVDQEKVAGTYVEV